MWQAASTGAETLLRNGARAWSGPRSYHSEGLMGITTIVSSGVSSGLRHALAAATLLAAPLATLAGAAQAEPHLMYLPGHAPRGKPAASTMLYYGGPVFSKVKVISVIWGSKVNSQVVSGIGGFYTAATNSTWFDIMAQYATDLTGVNGHKGTNQTISRGSYVGQVVITPHNTKTALTDKAVQKELLYQIKAGILPAPDANTLYMTYFPANITIKLGQAVSCSSFGAYHEGFMNAAYGGVTYGVMPDCGFTFADFTVVSSHELAEATTDNFPTPGSKPKYPQAWNTSDGYEIGDLCEGSDGTLAAGKTKYTVQQIFSNTTNACSTGNYTSP
jgi:hypothetical protein